MKVTVKCPNGHTYTYAKPRHYGGAAFKTQYCPKCGK